MLQLKLFRNKLDENHETFPEKCNFTYPIFINYQHYYLAK